MIIILAVAWRWRCYLVSTSCKRIKSFSNVKQHYSRTTFLLYYFILIQTTTKQKKILYLWATPNILLQYSVKAKCAFNAHDPLKNKEKKWFFMFLYKNMHGWHAAQYLLVSVQLMRLYQIWRMFKNWGNWCAAWFTQNKYWISSPAATLIKLKSVPLG